MKTDQKIQVFHPGKGTTKTTQTSGMMREELVSTSDTWVGIAQTEPEFTSGWHHHGDYDTYAYTIEGQIKFDFGKDGNQSCLVNTGEIAFIPRNTVHRESNPGKGKQVVFLVRVGKGAPVFNVEGP